MKLSCQTSFFQLLCLVLYLILKSTIHSNSAILQTAALHKCQQTFQFIGYFFWYSLIF